MSKIGRWKGYDVYNEPPEGAVQIPFPKMQMHVRNNRCFEQIKEMYYNQDGEKVSKAFFQLGDQVILANRPKEDK